MTFLYVKVQLHAAPGKAFVQQMRKGRRLTKVPLPAALAGKGLGEIGQIRGFIRGDHLCLYALTVMGKEGFLDRLADLRVSDVRQKLNQVGHAPPHGSDPFGLQFFLVGIQVVRQTAEIGVKKKGAVVEAAIQCFAIG